MRLIPSRHSANFAANFARHLGSKDRLKRKKRSLTDNLIGTTTAGKIARVAGGAIALDLGIRLLSKRKTGKVALDDKKYLPSEGRSSAREGISDQYQQRLTTPTKKLQTTKNVTEKPSKLEILKWASKYRSKK